MLTFNKIQNKNVYNNEAVCNHTEYIRGIKFEKSIKRPIKRSNKLDTI